MIDPVIMAVGAVLFVSVIGFTVYRVAFASSSNPTELSAPDTDDDSPGALAATASDLSDGGGDDGGE